MPYPQDPMLPAAPAPMLPAAPEPQGLDWKQSLAMLMPMIGAAVSATPVGVGAFGQSYARGLQLQEELRQREQARRAREAEVAYAMSRDQVMDTRYTQQRQDAVRSKWLDVLNKMPELKKGAMQAALRSGAYTPELMVPHAQGYVDETLKAAKEFMPGGEDVDPATFAKFSQLTPDEARYFIAEQLLPEYQRLVTGLDEPGLMRLRQNPTPMGSFQLPFAQLEQLVGRKGDPAPKQYAPGSFENFMIAKFGYGPHSSDQIREGRKEYQQADDRPRVDINMNPSTLEDIEELSDALVDGSMAPSMLAKRGSTYNTILAKARRKYREETGKELNVTKLENEYQAARRFILSMNSPQQGRFYALADSVMNTMDEVRALGQELKQGGVQLYNRAKRSTLQQLYGNTPYSDIAVRYMNAVTTLKEEFANLANGGYAPTESAWKLADEQINADYGVKDMTSAMVELRRLIGYRLQSFDDLKPWLPGGGGMIQDELRPVQDALKGMPDGVYTLSNGKKYRWEKGQATEDLTVQK